MARCAVCGAEELLPYRCKYCGEYFCAQHRLPEQHNCRGLPFAASPWEKEFKRARYVAERVVAPAKRERASWMPSGTEAAHLALGAVLVLAVGLSLVSFRPWIVSVWSLAIAVGFAASFLAHEYAHKIVAGRHGLLAEFRLSPMGAALTAISAIPFLPFKIVAPGAVVVSGPAGPRTTGMIAAAGPLTSLAVAAAFLGLGSLVGFPASFILRLVGLVNAWLALFNLFPLGPLDGAKVMGWNLKAWVAMFVASLILTAAGFMVL